MKKIIYGRVNLADFYLKELPNLSDVEVSGIFDCSRNNLTGLKGCPHTVRVDFECYNNKLSTLSGCPHDVGGNFDCGENPLTDLNDIPKNIGGNFYIDVLHRDKFSEEFIRSLSYIKGHVYYLNESGYVDEAPYGDY